MIEPDAPVAGAEAAVGLIVTEPVAPAWASVKDLSPMVRVAERAAMELLAAAVQVMVFSVVVTESHAGCPDTVHVL